MSKKDRQHQHIQPITPTLVNQPNPSLADGERRALEVQTELAAEIERLKAELESQRAQASEFARTANEAESQRKALHSDLMVLEQTAAGRAPDIALQTDLGKSAAHALSEVLTMLDKMNDERLNSDALPANGWSSPRARELVEAVQAQPGLRASDVRVLLLGDLLVELLPHAGETATNETAVDVLRRLRRDLEASEQIRKDITESHEETLRDFGAQNERLVKAQAALVARRAPDAEAGSALQGLSAILAAAGVPAGTIQADLDAVSMIVREWKGLRGFLSGAPLVAVAVRDDSTKEVRERYAVLLLEWDGKQVAVSTFDAGLPWSDVQPRMRQLVETRLVPEPYRT